MAQLLADFDTAHCGAVRDAQLDSLGQCLATASADGHVRLWDLRKPEDPRFLTDLGGHEGGVEQVAWAPPEVGVLLASAGSDGCVLVWGRKSAPGEWHVVHREDLKRHGAVLSVAWAPAGHGAVLACASDDGTVTVLAHQGVLRSGESTVEHRWERQPFPAQRGPVHAVSWAPAASFSDRPLGLTGARIAVAGEEGVGVWHWDEAKVAWTPGSVGTDAEAGAAALDVAWKAWDGVAELLASASGQGVAIWTCTADRWSLSRRVEIGEEVWRVSWADVGDVLLVSCGEEQRSVLVKRQLNGEWDVMDVDVGDN